jgi:hypothetical protein
VTVARVTKVVLVFAAAAAAALACSGNDDSRGAEGGRGGNQPTGSAGTEGAAGAEGDGSAGASPGGGGAGASGAGAGSGGGGGGAAASVGGPGGGGGVRDGGTDASAGAAAGSGGGAGEGPAAPAIPGAVLWFDAAKGVDAAAGKITRWADQSPAKNDAAPTAAANAPTLIAARSDNGRPAVHFDGKTRPAWLRIADADSLRWGTGDWTVLVAGSYDNALDGTHLDALGTFFSKHAQNSEILFCGNWPMTENTEKASLHLGLGEGNPGMESVRKDFNDGKVRVYGARRAAGTMELRVNGKVDSTRTGANGNIDLSGVALALGSAAGSSGRLLLRGDLQEVIAIKGTVTPAVLDAVEKYLMAKYAVAP